MQFTINDLQAVMFDSQANSYEKAVDKYIKNNKKRIDYWVTGEIK
jgi:glycine betaine/proline transport system substrate-binding protein